MHGMVIRKFWEKGATNLNEAMALAAVEGHLDIVKFCAKHGATHFKWSNVGSCVARSYRYS